MSEDDAESGLAFFLAHSGGKSKKEADHCISREVMVCTRCALEVVQVHPSRYLKAKNNRKYGNHGDGFTAGLFIGGGENQSLSSFSKCEDALFSCLTTLGNYPKRAIRHDVAVLLSFIFLSLFHCPNVRVLFPGSLFFVSCNAMRGFSSLLLLFEELRYLEQPRLSFYSNCEPSVFSHHNLPGHAENGKKRRLLFFFFRCRQRHLSATPRSHLYVDRIDMFSGARTSPEGHHQGSTSSAPGNAEVFSSASAVRVEELQRTLEMLYRDIIFPLYEPVERLRVVNNRAIRVQDLVDAIAKESVGINAKE